MPLQWSTNAPGPAASPAATAPEPTGQVTQAASKGIGPVKQLRLEPVKPELASKGSEVFQAKCSPCHRLDERLVGPPLRGVTLRRQPEWIMNMILNPMEMTQKDPVAKELLATYLTQMTFQNVSQDEARQLLEYFRQTDAGTPK
ncbi:MAG: cytochrome c [Oligoflexia bacterium]|nr:cytochrome c [Oligoflexia bacterium]